MKEFWESRYAETDYAYGKEPNVFLKENLGSGQTKKILLPGDGEGRNAVYAATKGWLAHAIDQSIEAKRKAEDLAHEYSVGIKYEVADITSNPYPESKYDAAALIFVHLPVSLRQHFHRNIVRALKPEGRLILEGFSKEHLKYNSVNPKVGGPQNADLLFSEEELLSDFSDLNIEVLSKEIVQLNEGLYHVGESAVIRLIGAKK